MRLISRAALEEVMVNRTTITLFSVAAAAALAIPAAMTPAAAQVGINLPGVSVNIGTPPPAPIYEAVPSPREGYAWAPGYWNWQNERHVWAPGHWIVAQPGQRWVADRWIEAPDGGWHYERGHWVGG
jgi:hypothetical protein